MKRNRLFYWILFIFLLAPCMGFYAEKEENPLLQSWPQYLKLKRESEFGLKWIHLGPVMNSARLESIQVDPTNPGTMYAAFGSGNLWKTENNGLSWSPIFENQSALGIGDIALAPSDPDRIWLGSGESLKKARNFTMPGTGVFRSDDGGKTWINTGLPDSFHIGEIAVHPENKDIVFTAVLGHFWTSNKNRGLYRTTDGGNTWEHVLYINERTGANDVVISPSDPDIIYVSMWENYPGIYGRESGVYKSSDGGDTWKRLVGGLPDGPKTGRIGLAVSWSDPEKVYALVDNLNKKEHLAAEVYKTLDGGDTWKRTHDKELLIFPGIGWYFTDCYVNPQDDEEIYALGVRCAHSSDGGRSFHLLEGDVFHFFPSPAETLHLDHCELWIHPSNPNHLALGNDGGLYVTYDKGHSWMHFNNIPAGEFYDISVDNQDPYFVYGGTQDDSSVYGLSTEWNPLYSDRWDYVWLDAWSGGDGCVTIPDPMCPDTVYFSSQYGGIRRKNMKTGRSVSIRPRLPKEHKGELSYTFVAPYIISPHNHLTLYHAGNYVFKTLNRGDSWELISPDLTHSVSKGKNSSAAGAIAESPLEPGLLYVGTDAGVFWVSRDDGQTWEDHSQGLPNTYLRSICPSHHHKSRVYVALTGINHDEFQNTIYVSDDYGQNWKSISSNLPHEVANCILEDPVHEHILYAGLYRGVYVSVDQGLSWSLLGPEMAPTCISDLVIQNREMDLVAGTHGRGIYKMNINPIQQAFKQGAPQENILFPTPKAQLPWFNDTHHDPRQKTITKVPITFYLLNDGELTLEVKKGDGSIVYSKQILGTKGFNQIRWNLVTHEKDSLQPYYIRYLRFPKSGNYQLFISGQDVNLKGTITIKKHPGVASLHFRDSQ
ncbi:MAG: hypothetical protein GF421_07915 [Candidatus Aminicenantes bacterium]|nr:hypothetical protein [Candidatus Aminicenantes bacterium]